MALKKIRSVKPLLYNHPAVTKVESKLAINSKFNTPSLNITRSYTMESKKEKSKYGDNMALVLHGSNNLKIEKRPIPKIKPSQVLLQMEVVSICGSDVHYYTHGRIGNWVVKKPMVIGHEGSATILECGSEVKTLKPGDRVAVEPQVNCRKCHFCKTGHYNLCENIFFCATPPDDGNLCTYFAHEADFCFKLPDNITLEQGSLMEPLSVGVHACRRGGVTNGDTVLILGSGPIGLVSLLAAKANGAKQVVVTDIVDFNLQKANELGADCAFNTGSLSDEDILSTLRDIMPEPPRVTIDACGFEKAVKIGMQMTKSGGKLILIGMGNDTMCLPMSVCTVRQIDMLGIARYVNDYPTSINMVSSGKIDTKPLITHHFKFEDAIKAFETAKERKENIIKIMIHANPKWKPEC
ncbi:sorbitol dehydrogenase-like [Sitophilus oryzae]|uniref:Sorbitol dehydrogenase n=1 Tax=Sitophilus oryzae TaxID=7048 RepID=A0A6J2XKJ1_SITOR|nr:sorbitol dehydrogenase-like [Sitophilus oryzae]